MPPARRSRASLSATRSDRRRGRARSRSDHSGTSKPIVTPVVQSSRYGEAEPDRFTTPASETRGKCAVIRVTRYAMRWRKSRSWAMCAARKCRPPRSLIANRNDRIFFNPALAVSPPIAAPLLDNDIIRRAIHQSDILDSTPPLYLTHAEANATVDAPPGAIDAIANALATSERLIHSEET